MIEQESRSAPSRRVGRFVTALLILLAVLAWVLCATSCLVEWSSFKATAPRPIPGGAQVQRDEVHYMFGHGRAMILSMNVYTGSFDHPSADINSRVLAWAVLPNYFPSILWGRCSITSIGPLVCIPLWMPAAVLTLFATARVVIVLRRVPPGRCRRCRYDLRETAPLDPDTVLCPECGLVQPLTMAPQASLARQS